MASDEELSSRRKSHKNIDDKKRKRSRKENKKSKKKMKHNSSTSSNSSTGSDNEVWVEKTIETIQSVQKFKNMIKHMIITMDSHICLSFPTIVSLVTGHCVLTPLQHVSCQLQLDEDIWEKMKIFKQTLIKMFTDSKETPILELLSLRIVISNKRLWLKK